MARQTARRGSVCGVVVVALAVIALSSIQPTAAFAVPGNPGEGPQAVHDCQPLVVPAAGVRPREVGAGGTMRTLIGPVADHDAARHPEFVSGLASRVAVVDVEEGGSVARHALGGGGLGVDCHDVLVVSRGRVQADVVPGAGSAGPTRVSLGELDMLVARPGWEYTLGAGNEGARVVLVQVRTSPGLDDPQEAVPPRSSVSPGPLGGAVSKVVARFRDQRPVSHRRLLRFIPPSLRAKIQPIFDILAPRELYLMAGGSPGFLNPAPPPAVTGVERLVLALALCPPSNGPALHIHRWTDEAFLVVRGSFRVTWGDDPAAPDGDVVAREGDIVKVPPSINRRFVNHSEEDGILMPIVWGTNNELDDIVFLPQVREQLRQEGVSEYLLAIAQKLVGVQFMPREDIEFPFGDCTAQTPILI